MKSSIKISNGTDEATPRPWREHRGDAFDSNGNILARVYGGKANAALIVKAVNEFEALSALEEAIIAGAEAGLLDLKTSQLSGIHNDVRVKIQKALAAISAVRKEGK